MKIHTVVFWVMILCSLQVGLKCLQVNTFSYPEDSHRILLHAGMYLPNSMNNCIDTLYNVMQCCRYLYLHIALEQERAPPLGLLFRSI